MKPFKLLLPLLCMVFSAGNLLAQETEAPAAEETTEQEVPQEEEKIVLTEAEQKAVDIYKTEMLAVQTWLMEYIESSHDNEARGHRIPIVLAEKLSKVKTEGLPAKITEPFNLLLKNQNAHAAHLKELPADDAEAMEWMANKLADEKWAQEQDKFHIERDDFLQKLVWASAACGAGREADIFQITELSQIKDRWVVILGAYKEFEPAKAEAEKVAKATNTPFHLRGMIFDKKGLRMPDDFEDEIYAGQYVQRGGNDWYEGETLLENHISVEMSEGYEGFEPGFYIPVGFIAESEAEADKKAAEFKKHAPGTYIKKTQIYYGCDR